MTSVEFVESEKGQKILYWEGYFYFKDKDSIGAKYWKCEQFKKGCKGRIISKSGVVRQKKEHNHPGTPEKLERRRITADLRSKAKISKSTPHTIIAEVTANSSEVARANLPSISSMKRTISNIRAKENEYPIAPTNRNALILPENFKRTDKGSQFLLFDSNDENRYIIFATQQNLQLLQTSEYWFADGTFKTVPNMFHQLFTVHGKVGSLVLPLVYVLMPSKQQAIYTDIFRQIKKAIFSFGNVILVKAIISDFELSVINALKEVFPEIKHYGCFFHFKQCLYRKIQNFGLKRQYDTDIEFQQKVKLLEALAFVPVNFVEKSFNIILEQNLLPRELQDFVDYFEDTWIGKFERRQRNPPRFPHGMWNCYDRVTEDSPITNNIVEGWHRGFLSQINSERPSVWNFLRAIKKEQNMTELRFTKESTGDKEKKRCRYRTVSMRLSHICKNFDEADIEAYIKNVAVII